MSVIGNAPGVSSQRVVLEEVVSGSPKSIFVPAAGYIKGYLDVLVNGTELDSSDFTAPDGITVNLAVAAAVGDTVKIKAWLPRGLSDGYLKSEADARFLSSTNGSVTPAKLSTGAPTWDSSGNVGMGVTPAYKVHAEGAVAAKRIGADQQIVLSADYGNVYVDSVNNANSSPMGIVFRHKISGGSLTEAVRITPGGIAFPPAQNPSSDANTLDDYEEGTWTPVLSGFSSVTYSYRIGTYTKIGRMVYVFWDFNVTSKTGTGDSNISGLPFLVSPSMAGYSVAMHRAADLFNANGVTYGQLKGFAQQNGTYIWLQVDNSTTLSFGTASTTVGYNTAGRSTGCIVYETP